MGETIKGLDYKTAHGAAMNGLPLKGMMAGELSDFIYQLLGDESADEGATRAILGSFNLSAKVTSHNELNNKATVEFHLSQKMTVGSLTRGVSKGGYEAGEKDSNAVAMSNAIKQVFPSGQRDVTFNVRWTEQIRMPAPE